MIGEGKIAVHWMGAGRKAKVKPNPAYPDGVDVDVSQGREPTCTVKLPYPAQEVGQWLIACDTCGHRAIITAAGRPDDPRSATVPCRKEPN